MAFLHLKTDDERDYLCSTSNIAGIDAWDKDEVYLTLQKGPQLLGRPGESKLQDTFRLKATRGVPAASMEVLAEEIASADKDGRTLDLRDRCILSARGPAWR